MADKPTLTIEDLDTELTTIRGAILNAIGSTGTDRLDALTLTEAAIKGLQGRLAQIKADPQIQSTQDMVAQVDARARSIFGRDFISASLWLHRSNIEFQVCTLKRPSVWGAGKTVAEAYSAMMDKLDELDPHLVAATLGIAADGTVLPEAREVASA